MASNPLTVVIPANEQCNISAFSRAAYYQKLTVTVGGFPYVFQGTGEGVPMKITTMNQTYLAIDPSTDAQNMSLLFQYSKTGSTGTFYNANVCAPIVTPMGPNKVQTVVTSEDGTDHDDNDTYVTILCEIPPS